MLSSMCKVPHGVGLVTYLHQDYLYVFVICSLTYGAVFNRVSYVYSQNQIKVITLANHKVRKTIHWSNQNWR